MEKEKLFKKFKQKMYRDKHKETTKQLQRNLYDLYKTEYTDCAFCGSIVSLHYLFYHLKTKKCTEIQAKEPEQKMIDFKRETKKLKSQLRFEYNQNSV